MIKIYRKKDGEEEWHWCSNCSDWPEHESDFETLYAKPESGKLCDECQEIAGKGNCDIGWHRD